MADLVIYKYRVVDEDMPVYELPAKSSVIMVGMEEGQPWPTIWAEVPHHQHDIWGTDKYCVVGTGQPYDSGEPVGSVQDGPYVWHVLREAR